MKEKNKKHRFGGVFFLLFLPFFRQGLKHKGGAEKRAARTYTDKEEKQKLPNLENSFGDKFCACVKAGDFGKAEQNAANQRADKKQNCRH